jgi:hypothetical protein
MGMNPKASFGNISQQAAGYNSSSKFQRASLLKLGIIQLTDITALRL